MAALDYKLSQVLQGHTEDVRAITTADSDQSWIFTGSRDATIRGWTRGPTGYEEAVVLSGHTGYVTALTAMLPGTSTDVPGLALLSGSRDLTACVWDIETREAVRTLSGHKYQVTGVGAMPGGQMATGEMDGTLRVWKAGKTIRTLKENDRAILCVTVLPNEDILTGSQDTTIKQWSGNHAHTTHKGHTDSVRGLCNLPGIGFVSASNDMTLRIWGMGGGTQAELMGHTALVYSCAATANGCIASGSEDNTFRLWDTHGSCLQSVELPGCVWSVAFTPAGDVVAGCADAAAYVFSPDAARQADAETITAFEAMREERKETAKGDTGGGSANTPIPEDQIKPESALLMPGQKANETMFVRKADDSVFAYAWNADSCEWDMLGKVTGSGPSGGNSGNKTWHDGKEWDKVISVEMDGGNTLKLPLNVDEDPYDVADRFLAAHNLDEAFRQQIVHFIVDNVGPGGTAGSGAHQTGNPDPLTGGCSYNPATESSAGGAPGAGTSGLTFTPHREYRLFEGTLAADKVATKLRELSAAVPADMQPQAADFSAGGAVPLLLAIANGGRGSLADVIDALGKLARWPSAQIFPVLDIFRLMVLNSGHARLLATDAGDLQAQNPGLGGLIARGMARDAPPAATLLATRLACNCCLQPPLRAWLWRNSVALLDLVAEAPAASNKTARVALATLLLNMGAAFARGEAQSSDEERVRALSILCEVMASAGADEHDSQFTALLAATTVAHGSAQAIEMLRDLGFDEQAHSAAGAAAAPNKLKTIAQDVSAMCTS